MSKLFSFLKKPIGILSIFLLIAILGFGYYFIKYNNATKNPGAEMAQKSEDTKKNTDDVVQKISKLMLVTDSSQAVLATITDKTKLSNQRFFDPAQNGDDLILLPNIWNRSDPSPVRK